jgi:hypothetical protein
MSASTAAASARHASSCASVLPCCRFRNSHGHLPRAGPAKLVNSAHIGLNTLQRHIAASTSRGDPNRDKQNIDSLASAQGTSPPARHSPELDELAAWHVLARPHAQAQTALDEPLLGGILLLGEDCRGAVELRDVSQQAGRLPDAARSKTSTLVCLRCVCVCGGGGDAPSDGTATPISTWSWRPWAGQGLAVAYTQSPWPDP